MPQVSEPLDERRTLWATSLQNQLASTHRRSRHRPLAPSKRNSRPSPQSKRPVKRTRPQHGHFSMLGTRRRSHVADMARSPLLTTRLVTAGTVELEVRVHLAQISQPNRDEDARNDADRKNSEHQLCSPAPIHAVGRRLTHPRANRQRPVHSVVAEPCRLWFFGHDHDSMDGLGERLANRLQSGRTRFPGAFQTCSVDRGNDRVF